MMDFDSMSRGMMSGSFGITMFFMWITYILIVSLLILGIIALWKYIEKK